MNNISMNFWCIS